MPICTHDFTDIPLLNWPSVQFTVYSFLLSCCTSHYYKIINFEYYKLTIVYNVWHYCYIICHKWKNKSLQGIVQCAMTMFLLFHDFFTSLSSIITSLLQRRPFLTTIIFFRPPNLNMVFFSTLGSDAMFLIRKGHTHNQFLVNVFHIFFFFCKYLLTFQRHVQCAAFFCVG